MGSKNKYKNYGSPRLTFPHKKPYDFEVLKDYIGSKNLTKMEKVYPEFDVVRSDDPKSELARLQIKLHATDKMLELKRKNLVEIRKDLDKQWTELDEKEKSLRENFRNFDQFIKENMEKRERADKKIKDDTKLCEQRTKDIDKCNKDFVALKEAKLDMDKKIKEYRLYENFLDRVVDTSQEFVAIQDMINRYMTLLNAKLSLAKLQEENLVALERAKSDMMKLIEEKNFIIMGLNNQIANLQARFENAKIKSIECEQLVLQIKNNSVSRHLEKVLGCKHRDTRQRRNRPVIFNINKTVSGGGAKGTSNMANVQVLQLHEIDEVKSSIWNLYCHMAQSKKHPLKIQKANVEEQMMYIKRTLTELAKVNQILRKRAKLNVKSKSKTQNI